MVAKLILTSIRQADGGKVTCTLQTEYGEQVKGVIEQSFFEEFFGGTATNAQQLSATRAQRVLTDNQEWLEAEAERQIALGSREVVIR